LNDAGDVNLEIIKFLNSEKNEELNLISTEESVNKPKFKYSCDILEKMFDEEFYGEL